MVTAEKTEEGSLVQISERLPSPANSAMGTGAAVGLVAGLLLSMVLLGTLATTALAWTVFVAPVVTLAVGLGLGRRSVLADVERSEATLEAALASLAEVE